MRQCGYARVPLPEAGGSGEFPVHSWGTLLDRMGGCWKGGLGLAGMRWGCGGPLRRQSFSFSFPFFPCLFFFFKKNYVCFGLGWFPFFSRLAVCYGVGYFRLTGVAEAAFRPAYMYYADAPSPLRRPSNRILCTLNLGHGETGCRQLNYLVIWWGVYFRTVKFARQGLREWDYSFESALHGRKTKPRSRCRREDGRPRSEGHHVHGRRPSPVARSACWPGRWDGRENG